MVQNKRLAKLVAGIALAPLVVDAHMIMKTPAPYGNPVKSPLDPSGSNFPCQNVAYTGTSNNWPVGSTQTLSWQDEDTAVHGGGSCQISVTTDKAPNKSSKWKVIHSIEGGCPAAFDGNLVKPIGQTDYKFPFTVPKELPNGEMSMAWTWFNREGNREMYMNCAPITVTGGASDTSAFDKLPDMAIANINVGTGSTCTTVQFFNYVFADPGNYVSTGDPTHKFNFVQLCGGAPATYDGGSGTSPAPSSGSGPSSSSPSGSYSAAPGSPASTMNSAAVAQPTAGGAPKNPPPTESKASASAPAAQPTASTPSTGNSPGNSSSGGSSCSPDGVVICQGTDMFAICDHGAANFMPVAQGTTCNAGVISKRNLHMHRHARRSF